MTHSFKPINNAREASRDLWLPICNGMHFSILKIIQTSLLSLENFNERKLNTTRTKRLSIVKNKMTIIAVLMSVVSPLLCTPSFAQTQSGATDSFSSNSVIQSNTDGGLKAKKIRIYIRNGLGKDALDLLHEMEPHQQITPNTWSAGRILWYEALCNWLLHREQLATNSALDSLNHGISELGVYHHSFIGQADTWLIAGGARQFPLADKKSVFRLTAAGPNDDPVGTVLGIVEKLNKIRKTIPEEQTIAQRVQLATWLLLLGEFSAAHPEMALPTVARSAISAGQEEMSHIEAMIDESPELEDEISADVELAIRLDTARVRSISYQRRDALAHEQEIERLHQLRNAIRSYRNLSETLVQWQLFQEIGDSKQTLEAAKQCLADLDMVYQTVESKKDFHLFDDEPNIVNSNEFTVVEVLPEPFSRNALSAMKSLQGLAYLPKSDTADASVVEQREKNAITWAGAALNDTDGPLDVPVGADSNNILAKWILALVKEANGDKLAMSDDSEIRSLASKSFVDAKTLLEEIVRSESLPQDSYFSKKANERLRELTSPEPLLLKARSHRDANEILEARSVLAAAIRRFRTPVLVAESIRLGIRSGIPPDNLQSELMVSIAAGIIEKDSSVSDLLLSEIQNYRAASVLTKSDPQDLHLSVNELADTIDRLDKWCAEDTLLPLQLASMRANFALAFAQKWALSSEDDTPPSKPDIAKAYRHAKDAEFWLVSNLSEIDGWDSEELLVNRGALVSSRLATGHLASLHLDDWQDDSRVSFLAAVDEASRVSDSTLVLPLLSKPLLKTVFDYPSTGERTLAEAERQRRKTITLCLEALFTSELGSPEAGATAMEKVVSELASSDRKSKETDKSLDNLSASLDGLDTNLFLPQTIRSFGVLTDIRAGKIEQALNKALSLSSDTHREYNLQKLKPDIIQTRITSTQSPLVAFTLGKAIESFLEHMPLKSSIDYGLLLKDSSLKCYQRSSDLLNTDRLQARFPHLITLIKHSKSRLETPTDAISASQIAIDQQHYETALKIASTALHFHRKSSKLWRIYFTAKQSASSTDESNSFIAELDLVFQKNLLKPFEFYVLRGSTMQNKFEFEIAEENYRLAIAAAKNPTQKIEALSLFARNIASQDYRKMQEMKSD